jgi:hypothetical protein
MTLKPSDMLEIQTAIDAYERKFPRRPAPSAEVALAWRLGKREVKRRAARQFEADPLPVVTAKSKLDSVLKQQECNWLVWVWQQMWLQLSIVRVPSLNPEMSEDLLPFARAALRVGWWGMVAVLTASVFFFGAIVGGYK